jgi:hypothetical protein
MTNTSTNICLGLSRAKIQLSHTVYNTVRYTPRSEAHFSSKWVNNSKAILLVLLCLSGLYLPYWIIINNCVCTICFQNQIGFFQTNENNEKFLDLKMLFRHLLLLNETLTYKDLMFRNTHCVILFGNDPHIDVTDNISEEL